MRLIFIFRLGLIYLALLISNSSMAVTLNSAESEQAIIQGFAKWQASRVERLVLDEAVDVIIDNQYVKRFFTGTTNNIQLYEGISSKRLIPLMQYYIKEDVLKFKRAVEECIPENVKKWGQDPVGKAEDALRLFEALTELSGKASQANTITIDEFNRRVCGEGPSSDGKISITTENLVAKLVVEKSAGAKSEYKIADIASALANDTKNGEGIRKLLSDLIQTSDGKQPALEDYIKVIEKFVEVVGSFQSINSDEEIYSVRIHQMILLIETFGGESKDYAGYSKLKSVSLFFGALADASVSGAGAADAVASVLDMYIDDRDAFLSKRADTGLIVSVSAPKYDILEEEIKRKGYWTLLVGPDVFFVSSYFGFSYAKVTDEIEGVRDWEGRAFGPVGIEGKIWSGSKGVLSVNYAPFDIGNYVTNELNGDEYDAKFEDIYSPSYFVSWTLKKKPLSFLAGYQTGIKYGNDLETEGPFVAVAFDLPIFTLY